MAYEIHGKPGTPVLLYGAASIGAPVATVTTVSRVFRLATSPVWTQVRVLEGAAAGTTGWVQTAQVTAAASRILATDQELDQLFTGLRTARFVPPSGVPLPIPYRYPTEGCFARAEVMAGMLADSGYEVNKVFALAAGAGGLQLNTPHGGDQPGFGDRLRVRWWYHVAPIVFIPSGGAKPTPVVLDPSVADGPITIADWVGRMTTRPVSPEMTYEELRQLLRTTGAYPVDRTLVVLAGRVVYSPPLASNPDATVVAVPASPALELARTAALVPAHDVVAGLDELFRACFSAWTADQSTRDQPVPYPTYTAQRDAMRVQIPALAPGDRLYIRTQFPNFFADWGNTFVGSGVEADFRGLRALLAA